MTQNPHQTPASEPSPLVSIVVLTFNSHAYLDACLTAVAQTRYPNIEVIVVDNASHDHSAELASEMLQRLKLRGQVIPVHKNLGCAGGNNVGWKAAQGEFVIFLNPDTEVSPTLVEELAKPLQHDPQIGVTGAKMYFPGGRIIQHAGGILYPNGMTDHVAYGLEDSGEPVEPAPMAYVTGAGMALRHALLEEVNGFDEKFYPAYYEEVDLCYRVWKSQRKVVLIPTATMIHHESVSLGINSPALRRLYPRMRIRFLLKNFSVIYLLRYALPFEIRWLLFEPGARGYRWQQFAAYFANTPLLIAKLLGLNKLRLQ